MKKKVILLFVLLCISFSLFAEIYNPNQDQVKFLYPGYSDKTFAFKDNRLERLGGTGTALSTGVSSLFYNPANLAETKGFKLSIPNLDLDLYGLAKILNLPVEGDDYRMKDFLKEVIGGKLPFDDASNLKRYVSAATKVLQTYSYGINPILNTQVDVGFTVGGFGLDVFGQADLTVYSMEGTTDKAKIVPEMNFGASIGYGHKFKLSNKISMSAGLSVSMLMRVYVEGFGMADLGEISGDFMTFIKSRPTGVGLQFPVNIGFTFSFGDSLKASLALRDLNVMKMKVYSYGDLAGFFAKPFQVFSGSEGSTGAATVSNLGSFGLPASLDVGIAFNPKWKWFNPRIEVDFVNLANYSQSEYHDYSNFFSHLKLGAELYLAEFLLVGGGLNQGRLSFGLTLDLWPVIIAVDYAWVDTTPKLGEAMSDRISVMIHLGWDRSK